MAIFITFWLFLTRLDRHRIWINLHFSLISDPMIYVFPRMTKCTFHKFGTSGNIEKHDALCILPLNIVNEKIYIFIWFWLLLLGKENKLKKNIKYTISIQTNTVRPSHNCSMWWYRLWGGNITQCIPGKQALTLENYYIIIHWNLTILD